MRSYNHRTAPNSATPDCMGVTIGGPVQTRYTPYGWRTARSRHAGGVNVVLADSSLKFVDDDDRCRGVDGPLHRRRRRGDGCTVVFVALRTADEWLRRRSLPDNINSMLDGSGMNVECTMPVGSLKPRMLLLGVLSRWEIRAVRVRCKHAQRIAVEIILFNPAVARRSRPGCQPGCCRRWGQGPGSPGRRNSRWDRYNRRRRT